MRRGRGRGRPGGDRRRPPPLRRRARRGAAGRRGRPARPAASAAHARASSACTPTTPGTSPAATIRSGGGSRASLRDAGSTSRSGPSSTPFSPRRRATSAIPVGPALLLAHRPRRSRPADARQLTNAIGRVADHVDDVVRELPEVVDAHDVHVRGDERGTSPSSSSAPRRRRRASSSTATPPRRCSATLATESRADRLHNPGLDPALVDTVLAASCVLVGHDAPAAARRGHDRGWPPDGPAPLDHRRMRRRRRSACTAAGSCCAR